MRIPKRTPELAKQLGELQKNRNKIDEYLVNFLINFSQYARLMHKMLKEKENKDLIKVSTCQYLSSLVTCWETFFRDITVYITSIDSHVKDEILLKLKLKNSEIEDIEADIKIHEYLSKCFNFQNLTDVRSALFPLFNADLFSVVTSYRFLNPSTSGSQENLFCIELMYPDYSNVLDKVFELRHQIVHDANAVKGITFDGEFIQKFEYIFLFIPQVLSMLLCNKYKLPRIVFEDNGKSYHYIASVGDLIADDWYVVPENGEEIF